MKKILTLGFVTYLLFNSWLIFDVFGIERRREQYGSDFSYFFYPLAGTIPGLGSATGGGFSVLNLFETDVDITGFSLKGDFDASGLVILDLHLIPETLVFDVGKYTYRVATKSYTRGMDSDKDQFIFVEAEGQNSVGQLTLSFFERMLESYYRYSSGQDRLLSLLNSDGEKFKNTDTDWKNTGQTSVGGILDWTDDRLDPRMGLRLEMVRKTPLIDDELVSKYHVDEVNLSAYIPIGLSTLALNYYKSDAIVYDKATTDRTEIASKLGISCDPASPEYTQCTETLNTNIDAIVARNKYGTATPLGGTQRLRSYPGNRFYASHTVFWGAEARWNLNDVEDPFDFIIAKGVHTGFQLAVFAEQGAVADDEDKLLDNLKSSYGVGFRVLLSGVIMRLDWATGDEGSQVQFFMNYSWGLFSVDSPG